MQGSWGNLGRATRARGVTRPKTLRMVMELATIVADPAHACKDTCEQVSLPERGSKRGGRGRKTEIEMEMKRQERVENEKMGKWFASASQKGMWETCSKRRLVRLEGLERREPETNHDSCLPVERKLN